MPVSNDDAYTIAAGQTLHVGQGAVQLRPVASKQPVFAYAGTLTTGAPPLPTAAAAAVKVQSTPGTLNTSPLVQQSVTTLTVTETSGGAQSNLPVTFGHYFKSGDVPAGASVQGQISGAPITTETVHKATHADGSLRHAIVTCVVPSLSANGSQTITLATVAQPAAPTAITKDQILATAFDADVTCTIGGTAWTLTARQLLAASVPVTFDETWIAGQQCTEYLLGGRLRNGGFTHAHLTAYFHIRAHAGLGRIRCDVVVENGWTFTAGAGRIDYQVAVNVGGALTYTNASFAHYHHSRWTARGLFGSAIPARVAHNTAYLKSSKAVPNYGPGGVSEGVLNSFLAYSPGSNVDLRTNWGDTGYHEQIGVQPGWDAAYVKSGDTRAYDAVVANSLAGLSYSYHYRDENTGYPPLLDTYPTLCESEQTGGIVIGTGGNAYSHEPGSDPMAHQPLLGYLAYVLTGDYVHLEELQFLANYNMVWTAKNSRAAGTGNTAYGVCGGQLRGRAWGMRTVAHVAAITPDSHVLKAYFAAKANNHISHYTSAYATIGGSDYNPLGAIQDYDWNNSVPPKYSPWQADFFALTVGRMDELGLSCAALRLWSSRWPTGRMGQPGIGNGYCRYYATDYQFTSGIVDSGGAYNTSFSQLYTENWNLSCTPPGPSATVGWMHDGSLPNGVTNYYSNLGASLALAVDNGVAGINTWRQWQTMGLQDYSSAPVWHIVPRIEVPAWRSALAPQQWHAFNSPMSAVNPCPGNNCVYSGGEGQAAVMDDWSGGAYDLDGDYLIVWGGGHAGSAENTVYRFGPLTSPTPAWSRASEPSTNIQQTVLHYPDGAPSARHTYDAIDYDPNRKEFFSLSAGGTWSGSTGDPAYGYPVDSFNFVTGQWKTDWVANFGSSGSIGAVCCYNPIDGCFWYHATTAASPLVRYDPKVTNGSRTNYAANVYLQEEGSAAIDTKRNRMVVIGRSGGQRQMFVWDLNNPNSAPTTPTTTGAAGGIALESISGPGFFYDPIGDRYIGWGGGSAVYALNASTWVWSQLTLAPGNAVTPTTANSRGTYGRFRYSPRLEGAIVVNRVTEGVYFFSLRDV